MTKRQNMDCYDIGDHAEMSKTVSEYDVYGFAGITGDFYRVHLNEEYARGTRFRQRIAQGALSVGFLATCMGYMAERAPASGAVSYRYDITFNAPVYLGDTVTARVELVEKEEDRNLCIFRATVCNQNGDLVAQGKTYLKVL